MNNLEKCLTDNPQSSVTLEAALFSDGPRFVAAIHRTVSKDYDHVEINTVLEQALADLENAIGRMMAIKEFHAEAPILTKAQKSR